MTADNIKAVVLRQMVAEAESDLAVLNEKAALQKKYVADLRQRLAIAAPAAGDAASTANTEVDGAILNPPAEPVTGPAISVRIVQVLNKARKPMRLTDIAEKVEQGGAVSEGKKGVISNVASAIRRRNDLFIKKGRGIYGLKEWETNGRTTGQTADH